MTTKGKLLPSILCTLGAILSGYAVYVEHRMHSMEENDNIEEFVALCDIESIGASCSKTFSLPQGKLLSYFNIIPHDHVLDVPNALLGLCYYIVVIILENSRLFHFWEGFTLALVILSFMTSVYLAYTLTVLNELCILCWTTHVINTTMLVYYVTRRSYTGKIKQMWSYLVLTSNLFLILSNI